jgi:hypothetical protein
VVVELNRGWNSRLGFSLQKQNGATVISAIYPDSVASRDGRLRVGDKLIIVSTTPFLKTILPVYLEKQTLTYPYSRLTMKVRKLWKQQTS